MSLHLNKLDFSDTFDVINNQIDQSIKDKMTELTKTLSQNIRLSIKNDFIKKIHQDNEIFTIDYKKCFLQKYSSMYGEHVLGIKSFIDTDEYCVYIYHKDINNNHRGGRPSLTVEYALVVTNKLNIYRFIKKDNYSFHRYVERHDQLLNDLQIDLLNCLCLPNLYNFRKDKHVFLNKFDESNDEFQKICQNYNSALYRIKSNDPKINIDTIKNNITNNLYNQYQKKYPELYDIVLQMIFHPFNVYQYFKRFYDSQVFNNGYGILKGESNLELRINRTKTDQDKRIKELEEQINDLPQTSPKRNELVNNLTQTLQSNKNILDKIKTDLENIKESCLKINHSKNIREVEILINTIVKMFATFWNGKTLTPYAKKIKLENNILREKIKEYQERENDLIIKEKELSMKTNLKNLIIRNKKLKKKISDKQDIIKRENSKSKQFLEEIKIADKEKIELSEELTKKEKLLLVKEKELDERKIKLEQFKILLTQRAKELKDEKAEFERVRKDLLNLSTEIDEDILKDFKNQKYKKKNIINGVIEKKPKSNSLEK